MNNFGLSKKTFDEILNYFKNKPEIEKVLIFGSRAKGTFHNGSDIDFAIFTNRDLNFSNIWANLDELNTPYKFDVIDYKNTDNAAIKKSIDKEGVLFYKKQTTNTSNKA